jgi:hypothetical protein
LVAPFVQLDWITPILSSYPQAPKITKLMLTERYYGFEIFFLPIARLAAWLLGSAVIHLGIRLSGRKSDIDQILNIGGLVYLVVMPYTFAVDWTAIALDAYGFGLIAILHGTVDLVWSITLSVIGLRQLLGIETRLALGLMLLNIAVTLPLLILFAR